jgi:phenylpropionate dioxygenase-like ring-hydroxylating dioxygenase large terminal subunit
VTRLAEVGDPDGFRPITSDDLDAALAWFWHPVCRVDELAASPSGVLGVRLLGRALVVADLGDETLACLEDRCLHRSTRLSVGWVDHGAIRCAYHGWRWAGDGRCVEIPSMPGRAITAQARQASFEIERRYDLVWVRLRSGAGTTIPACPGWDDPTMKVLSGDPYTWPVAAARRLENFTDLSHFAWVHDGSLGRRDEPVPPVPDVRRHDGELRFEYLPPPLVDQHRRRCSGPARIAWRCRRRSTSSSTSPALPARAATCG